MSADYSFSFPGTATVALLTLLLAACGTAPPTKPDLINIPSVTPRNEPPSASGNPRTYQVFGETYTVSGTSEGYRERGVASWYGAKFHGRRTSSGPPFDMYAVTAAHKSLPLPTYVRVTNLRNGHSLVVKVTDRGPFVGDRIIDLSYAAAAKLDMVNDGIAPVEVEALQPYQYLPGFPYDNPQGRIASTTIPSGSGRDVAPAVPSPTTTLRFAKQEQPDNEILAANFRLAAYRYPTFSEGPTTLDSGDLTATSLAATPVEPQLLSHNPGRASAASAQFPTRGDLTPGAQHLYLQVGAFGHPANAEELRQRLARHLPYDVSVLSDGQLHRVKIGPLGREVDLGALNNQLATLGLQTIHVVLE